MDRQRSKEMFQQASAYIPGGVNSPVRSFANVGIEPVFIERGEGSHIYDVDGNEYIDYIGSWGPLILGHTHPAAKEALLAAAEKGFSFGLPTSIETKVAELMVEMYPGMEKVRMVNSGTEATMSALRAARGYTGRDKIIKFEGCYHGHSDGLLVKSGSGTLTFGTPTSPGVPADITKNTLVSPYNDLEYIEKLAEANPGEVAAIILEPVAANMGLVPAKREFLEGLRALCDREGIVLIFDEVITGFRLSQGGAAEYYGVTPDMGCFGKIIGGGLPVGAYGGKKEIMNCIAPQGKVYQAGTLSGNPLAMHVGLAQLTYLKEHPELYPELERKTKETADAFRAVLEEYHVNARVVQLGSLMTVFFTDRDPVNYQDVSTCDTEAFSALFVQMLDRGIMMSPSQFEVLFLGAAHSEKDLEYTVHAFRESIKELYS